MSDTAEDEELKEAVESIKEQMNERDYENIDVKEYLKDDEDDTGIEEWWGSLSLEERFVTKVISIITLGLGSGFVLHLTP